MACCVSWNVQSAYIKGEVISFAGWRYTIRKVFLNVFKFQVVTKPPRRTSVIVLTFVADQVPI